MPCVLSNMVHLQHNCFAPRNGTRWKPGSSLVSSSWRRLSSGKIWAELQKKTTNGLVMLVVKSCYITYLLMLALQVNMKMLFPCCFPMFCHRWCLYVVKNVDFPMPMRLILKMCCCDLVGLMMLNQKVCQKGVGHCWCTPLAMPATRSAADFLIKTLG